MEIKHRAGALVLLFIHTRTRTYILFCDKTRVPMFHFIS